jgi:hypothetical protein
VLHSVWKLRVDGLKAFPLEKEVHMFHQSLKRSTSKEFPFVGRVVGVQNNVSIEGT